MAKQEQIVCVTDPGTFVFSNLHKARDYENNGKFAFDTRFLLLGAAADKLRAQVDQWMLASQAIHKKKLNDPPYGDHLDRDKNVVPGVTEFKFKVYTTPDWPRQPKFFDGGGNLIPPVNIGNGSRGRIKYEVYFSKGGNKSGVMLQPVEVQISKLVPGFSGRNYGGFAADPEAEYTYSNEAPEGFNGSGTPATGGEI